MSVLVRRLVLLLATLACVSAVMAVVSAPARAGTNPVLIAPVDGSQVELGFTGPIQLDMGDSGDWFDVRVAGPSGVIAETTLYGYDSVEEFSVPALVEGGDYRVQVSSSTTAGWTTIGTFSAPWAPLSLGDPVVSPATFYPIVRDGYRDRVGFSITLNQRAEVTTIVRNSAGRTVRIFSQELHRGRRTVYWNGLTNAGAKVPAGRYRITLEAQNGAGESRSVSRVVTATTAVVTRTATKRRNATQASPATRGSCYITWQDGSAELDCWGGRYARLSFGFAIPASAWEISWSVSGERSALDRCCDGSIRKSGSRPSQTRYVVATTVTGWRAYWVHSATLRYKYRARI
ncbi:hypothetical protein BJ993_002719 [Nocardioides aromaticivorans]|uniref:FlgD/Vpr Ig-like domain-containing protein n=1 Tax=Nocardioides aromaticivorans TaxID=200618 RepID=A0A7Y9ZHP8_9ACTN|nr:FlgD immunoglobulin-like domain containing protein [Nocardioides aromaticivorans]NYI45639.1 hypothetical protein [Nocardioides aromaticivorans]